MGSMSFGPGNKRAHGIVSGGKRNPKLPFRDQLGQRIGAHVASNVSQRISLMAKVGGKKHHHGQSDRPGMDHEGCRAQVDASQGGTEFIHRGERKDVFSHPVIVAVDIGVKPPAGRPVKHELESILPPSQVMPGHFIEFLGCAAIDFLANVPGLQYIASGLRPLGICRIAGKSLHVGKVLHVLGPIHGLQVYFFIGFGDHLLFEGCPFETGHSFLIPGFVSGRLEFGEEPGAVASAGLMSVRIECVCHDLFVLSLRK